MSQKTANRSNSGHPWVFLRSGISFKNAAEHWFKYAECLLVTAAFRYMALVLEWQFLDIFWVVSLTFVVVVTSHAVYDGYRFVFNLPGMHRYSYESAADNSFLWMFHQILGPAVYLWILCSALAPVFGFALVEGWKPISAGSVTKVASERVDDTVSASQTRPASRSDFSSQKNGSLSQKVFRCLYVGCAACVTVLVLVGIATGRTHTTTGNESEKNAM